MIVYCHKKESCDMVHSWLCGIAELGFSKVAAYHGDVSSKTRTNVMERWTSKELRVVVATVRLWHTQSSHSLITLDCNSCYNHHMAGMANTAPRPCLFTHSLSHSHIHSLSPVLILVEIKGTQDHKISHAHSLILTPGCR